MIIYKKDKDIAWKLENIRFLYPPDDFTGTFGNAKMQERHKATQDQKVNVILEHLKCHDNPLEAMGGIHPLDHLQFLHNNLEIFRKFELLEKTVLQLYCRKNTPFAMVGDYNEWKSLLAQCDPARMYKEGKPVPFDKTTAYRGSITGNPKGLSWTVNREEAAWFLDRWKDKSLGGGSVFAMEITRQDVLVYIEERHRREVILLPEMADTSIGIEIDHL